MAVDSLNLSVAGKPYVATQSGDGKITLASPDGKDAQSMDIEQFKKYLAEHANEIKVAQPTGDTLETSTKPATAAAPAFKGHGEEEGEKKGLTTGTKILIGAGLIALGVWQHKNGNLKKGWEALKGFFKKAEKTEGEKIEETLAATGGKQAKSLEEAKTISGLKQTKEIDAKIEEEASRMTPEASAKREAEIAEAAKIGKQTTTETLSTGEKYKVTTDADGHVVKLVDTSGKTIKDKSSIANFFRENSSLLVNA